MQYVLDFTSTLEAWPELLLGLWRTLVLTMWGGAIGLSGGLCLAVFRSSTNSALRIPSKAFIEVVRNTPLLVQVFFIFFGLPSLGLRMGPDTGAVLALGLNAAAYFAEIMRAGIQSVPKGQREAAYALGLNPTQAFLLVVLKPALSAVYPALTSQVIMLFLGTSIVSSISAVELTSTAQEVQAATFRTFEAYFVITFIYLGLSIALSFVLRRVGYRVFSFSTVRR
ncbi:amino acid ABC transporter permease [Paraburkholderia sp. EG285A]|uniref:amino acid ABC transporter permease n=1 Tax=Paraburkholderia sp. EG285A TaxID=3237009 RepID=UPI0034D23968